MPRKPQKPLTEEEKFRQQEQREQELQSLQRQYTILEKDRALYSSGIRLQRLNKNLEILKNEHRNILIDLEVATADAKRQEDSQTSNQLNRLLLTTDYYRAEVKNEKQHMLEIEGQIKRVGKEVVALQSKQVTDRQFEERTWHAMKTVEGLMNKLDVQNKKFGVICAKNREIKQEINRMLWLREQFMKDWNKLIRKLAMGKQFMLDLIEQATIAYDQREEWCSKLQALRMKAHLDLVTHTQEMRELKRKQDNHKKLEAFYNTKGMKRVMADLLEKRRLKRMQDVEHTKDLLEKYNNFVEEIVEFTKVEQLADIAVKYYRQEEENLSLFKYVNELMEELEEIHDKYSQFRDDITDQRALEASRSDQRAMSLENLQKDTEKATKELDECENDLKDVEDYIQSMLNGIEGIFKICKCPQDPVLQLLGDNTHVNYYNYNFYINMIESYVHKAMVEVFQSEKIMIEKRKLNPNQRTIVDDPTKDELKALDQIVEGSSPCPLCITHEMVNDVVDTLQHVHSKKQVKKMLKEKLKMPEFMDNLHNVSNCFLPEAREIIQKRYQ